jgi:hypothetical protein
LQVALEWCGQDPRLEVRETDDSVRITAFPGTTVAGDCQGGGRVVLDGPLGTRTVVDGFDGSVVSPEP